MLKEKISKQSILILVLIIILLGSLFTTLKVKEENARLKERINQKEIQFELISESVAWYDAGQFLEKQKKYHIQYAPLKENITRIINSNAIGTYGVYFEDLNTGASIGINEKEKYLPMSLFKVPLMMSILKKVETGEHSLDDKVILTVNDLDSNSGLLYLKGAGYQTTMRELIDIMITESDNTAMRALANRYLDDGDYFKALSIMGLPTTTDSRTKVSAKEYSNIFRSLYFSNYLRRPFSELALTILLDTKFNSQIPAGVDERVKVSHKVGFDYGTGYFHDCGIIYVPEENYILCIMAKNTTQENADLVISKISESIFDYKTDNLK
ncbi:MAG: serine hydrolase [Nanoarchaeota archaeon]|nr:serine hydrolase [Nanoarchaeota archaeon]